MEATESDPSGPADESEEDFVASISPDVIRCLYANNFFARLDDLFSPPDASHAAVYCGHRHSFTHSISVLESLGFDHSDIDDVVQVLIAQGACCDCEVLYNVAEDSRLKAKYWQARAESFEVQADESSSSNESTHES